MKRIILATWLAGVTVLLPGLRSADPKPDFTGTWDLDATRSDSAQSGAGNGLVTEVIKQTSGEFSLETRKGGQTETLVYKLDGTETTKPPEDNGPYRWQAQWDGTALTTVTQRNINRTTITVKETRSLDPQGKEMIVNRMLTVQHGYQMQGAKNYSSGKDVFVKAFKP